MEKWHFRHLTDAPRVILKPTHINISMSPALFFSRKKNKYMNISLVPLTERENMNPEEQMLLFSDLCSELYHHQVPEGGERRPRGRRKKEEKEEKEMAAFKKRKLSAEQVNFLEKNFGNERKLESSRKVRLASELGLDPRQVAVWFQNRRARWKSKQLEEEYKRLKTMHEAVVMEKCQLEAEVLKLRDQLSDAEKEVKKLSERRNGSPEGERSCSPRSSFSMDTPFLGEFGEDLFYVHENIYINNGMEWVNYYDI